MTLEEKIAVAERSATAIRSCIRLGRLELNTVRDLERHLAYEEERVRRLRGKAEVGSLS